MQNRSAQWTFVLVITSFVFATFPHRVSGQITNNSLLNQAIAGNEQSLGSIQTLFTKVEFSILPANQSAPSLAYTSEYWRANDIIRVRQLCTQGEGVIGQIVDYDCRKGVQRALTSLPGSSANTVEVGMTITPATTKVILTDGWKLALCVMPQADSDEKPARTFNDACRTMTVTKVTKLSNSDFKGARVELKDDSDGSSFDVWIDSSVNWLVRKVVRNGIGTSGYRVEYEAADYREFQPGIFFPTKSEIRGYLNGSLNFTKKTEFTNVKINELERSPITLELPFKSGMPVKDDIKGMTYEVDNRGNRITQSQPTRHAPPTVPPKPSPSSVLGPIADRNFSFWIAAFSVVMLVAALVIHVRRKQHSANS